MADLQVSLTGESETGASLRELIEAVGRVKGPDYFQALALQLSRLCGADYAFIATPRPNDPAIMQTTAVAGAGRLLANIDYAIAGTPCEQTVKGELCYFPSNTQRDFPDDRLLAEMGVDCYLGSPLFSSAGELLGIIVLLHREPLRDPELAISLVRILSNQAGVELEREVTEKALRSSEALNRELLHFSPMAMLIAEIDPPHRVLKLNASFTEVFGYGLADVPDMRTWQSLAFPGQDALARAERKWATQINAIREEGGDPPAQTVEIRARDGSTRVVEVSMRHHAGRILCLYDDITERTAQESAFNEASRLEQARLAREVHDGLGQQLTGLSLLAQTLAARSASDADPKSEDLRQLADLAAAAVSSCRAISHGLMPLNDTGGDLGDALQRLAHVVRAAHPDVEVEYVADYNAALLIDNDRANHLYRIAQEALNNAIRHSGCSRVVIHLGTDNAEVALRIEDDGRGIAVEAGATGLGMKTMRYRASAVRGQLHVHPRLESGGTRIACLCPNDSLH